jgi:hypothetical protein
MDGHAWEGGYTGMLGGLEYIGMLGGLEYIGVLGGPE